MSNDRNSRDPVMRDLLEIAQDEFLMRDRIAGLLEAGPKTIPEIAAALERPAREVVVWLFGMRRYGRVEEVGRADIDGYFKYRLTRPGNE